MGNLLIDREEPAVDSVVDNYPIGFRSLSARPRLFFYATIGFNVEILVNIISVTN